MKSTPNTQSANQFGKKNFTNKDLVVRKNDVDKYHQFLNLCYKKMIMKKSTDCWTYLRFCFKVQGVKDELIADNKSESVAFQELREQFPSGTSFAEYWPNNPSIRW